MSSLNCMLLFDFKHLLFILNVIFPQLFVQVSSVDVDTAVPNEAGQTTETSITTSLPSEVIISFLKSICKGKIHVCDIQNN